jgi:hypothetical protein
MEQPYHGVSTYALGDRASVDEIRDKRAEIEERREDRVQKKAETKTDRSR